MKNIIKTNEITKIATDDIAANIANGWMVNPAFNCGHQGEIFKFALVKDGKTRMFSITLSNEHIYGNLVYLVEDFDFGFEFFNSMQTAWIGKGEEVKKEIFYSVSKKLGNDNNAYTTDEEFSKEVSEKRYTRFSNRNCNCDRYLNVRKSEIKKFLKKVPGYKRVKEEDIKSLAVYFDWNGGKHYQISFYNKKALVYNL